jgi:hypothetical protein
MKKTILTTLALNVMLFFLLAFTTHAEEVVPSPNHPLRRRSRKTNKTDIPAAITTSNSVETRLGTLKFTDGFPHDATGFG